MGGRSVAGVAGLTVLGAAALWAFSPAAAQDGSDAQTFGPAGDTVQSFTVPDGVTCLTIEATGAQGGDGGDFSSGTDAGPEAVIPIDTVGGTGGNGAQVTTTVAVAGGDVLDVLVGLQGGEGDSYPPPGIAPAGGGQGGLGGFADGADGGDGKGSAGGGGGGKTEVSPAAGDPFVVAGGGGGGGGAYRSDGGAGGAGGEDGGAGADSPGTGDDPIAGGGGGGTQTDPGAGGVGGQPTGTVAAAGLDALPAGVDLDGDDGDGSAGGEGGIGIGGAGGGGGGYFGGGGGGGGFNDSGAGGGAGSSFASETAEFGSGVQAGDGAVTLSWTVGDDSCVQGTDVARPLPVSPAFTG